MPHDDVTQANPDRTTRASDNAQTPSPVPTQDAEALLGWMRKGRELGVADVRLDLGAWLWYEEDDIYWEPW